MNNQTSILGSVRYDYELYAIDNIDENIAIDENMMSMRYTTSIAENAAVGVKE